MYDVKPNLIIGFHGCEAEVRDILLQHPNDYKISQQPFDWLGHGLYFWENNYDRAVQWANEKKDRGSIKHPAVIGAVLHLGYCCDFLDKRHITLLAKYFAVMQGWYKQRGKVLPENKNLPHDPHKDHLLRNLDCAAIEFMHSRILSRAEEDLKTKGFTQYKIFDSTRGVFTEGGPAFKGAGLFEKSHIQICVRNPNCIKGFFMPREETDFIEWLNKQKQPSELTSILN
ncbi:hypothetical protein SAMN05518672_113155 [Chitinophaga sp. CF118]|uniref:hypothetical protein n=1 Tax=Chitinophaga sp. CF118 TaxID=1884367 RepID=UPI0008ECE7F4|nr:hypothetical protein [Chitinophaga sp. CF118]SFE98440.1 hypothetical protein SAMN05518672_113155 [Chitinophaga sp. CF118]